MKDVKKNSLIRFIGLAALFTVIFMFVRGAAQAKAAERTCFNVSEVSIAKDGVFRLRAYNVPRDAKIHYVSTDTSVAYVDGRGYITGISNGECIVVATVTVGGAAVDVLNCKVTVGPAAISIKLTKSEIVMGVGMKKTLKTIISPLNTVEKPVFYSADKEVASVTSIGRVRAKGIGETSIFAFLMNGETAECRIYVLDEEDYNRYNATGTLVGIIEGYSESDDDGRITDENNENQDKEENTSEDESDETEDGQKETSKESEKTAAKEQVKEDTRTSVKETAKESVKETAVTEK